MRILLDMQGFQSLSRYRGIGRSCMSLAVSIARVAEAHDVRLLLNGNFLDCLGELRDRFDGLVPLDRFAVFKAPANVSQFNPHNLERARIAELLRERAVGEIKPDIVHVASLFEGFADDSVTSTGLTQGSPPVAVTLHDLIPLADPRGGHLINKLHEQWYFRKIEQLRRAQVLLAVSDWSRNQAIELLGLPCERVVNISSAANPIFRKIETTPEHAAEIRRKFGIRSPFVLTVGVAEPRKNFLRLMKAFRQLPDEIRRDYQLVIVGDLHTQEGRTLCHAAQKLGFSGNEVVLTNFLPDDDVVSLYNLCQLFVFPSLSEGFGLPALEAMACGAATIGSNATSVPEVIGRSDALFDPNNTSDIAKSMHRAVTDEDYRTGLRIHAERQAARFSWDESARRTIEAFQCIRERTAAQY